MIFIITLRDYWLIAYCTEKWQRCQNSILCIIDLTTGTLTAFPSCLYRCVSDCPSVHPSGNPCNLSHSIGVNRLILELIFIPPVFAPSIV